MTCNVSSAAYVCNSISLVSIASFCFPILTHSLALVSVHISFIHSYSLAFCPTSPSSISLFPIAPVSPDLEYAFCFMHPRFFPFFPFSSWVTPLNLSFRLHLHCHLNTDLPLSFLLRADSSIQQQCHLRSVLLPLCPPSSTHRAARWLPNTGIPTFRAHATCMLYLSDASDNFVHRDFGWIHYHSPMPCPPLFTVYSTLASRATRTPCRVHLHLCTHARCARVPPSIITYHSSVRAEFKHIHGSTCDYGIVPVMQTSHGPPSLLILSC